MNINSAFSSFPALDIQALKAFTFAVVVLTCGNCILPLIMHVCTIDGIIGQENNFHISQIVRSRSEIYVCYLLFIHFSLVTM